MLTWISLALAGAALLVLVAWRTRRAPADRGRTTWLLFILAGLCLGAVGQLAQSAPGLGLTLDGLALSSLGYAILRRLRDLARTPVG